MVFPRFSPVGRRCLAVVLLTLGFAAFGQAQTPAQHDAAASDSAQHEADSGKGQLPLKELRTFTDVFEHIRDNYVNEVDDKTLLENAIKGMLSGLDPHSAYLDRENFDELKSQTTGEFGGLGLEVGMDDGFVRVITPIDDTPAKKAGIETGDIIVKLDDKPMKGMSLNQAVAMMRGPRGSKITLTIVREGVNKPFDVTVTRDVIKVVSVRSRMLEPGYGYLRIAQFQTETGDETVKAIKQMEHKGPLKGLVLDLRNNPGGVLQSSVQVADALLDGGMVVYTKGRIKDADVQYHAAKGDITHGIPVVALINGGSASAAEIVAGALQDHRRAVIMGTTSFGKGSVQTVMPIAPDKAIKLTTALYFTPSGRSIQAQGIKPDIVVEPAKVQTLRGDEMITEADLSGHLHNVDGASDSNSAARRAAAKGDALLTTDNQLYEALSLLKGVNILGRWNSEPRADATQTARR